MGFVWWRSAAVLLAVALVCGYSLPLQKRGIDGSLKSNNGMNLSKRSPGGWGGWDYQVSFHGKPVIGYGASSHRVRRSPDGTQVNVRGELGMMGAGSAHRVKRSPDGAQVNVRGELGMMGAGSSHRVRRSPGRNKEEEHPRLEDMDEEPAEDWRVRRSPGRNKEEEHPRLEDMERPDIDFEEHEENRVRRSPDGDLEQHDFYFQGATHK